MKPARVVAKARKPAPTKNTVTNIASPRPRTESGSATRSVLRSLLDPRGLQSLRLKRVTAFMHGAVHDNEAAFLHRYAKAFVRYRFLGIARTVGSEDGIDRIGRELQES
jgi:hypothetical protein